MKHLLFEVTQEEIKSIDSEQLWKLVSRLCEADVARAGDSTSCVKHGGVINESDSGLDIVIEWGIDPPQFSHIPRKITGIQVKAEDMPANKILTEMTDHIGDGKSITRLAEQGGAYIIVSSKRSCTNRVMSDRQDAMSLAVSSIPEKEKLLLQFYDSQLITTWVNEYPSVIIWVRAIGGKPLSGWYPYDNWSHTGPNEEYIHDDKLRLFEYPGRLQQKTTVVDGINAIRARLSIPGSSVRLVGLSGVGKTRLIQALFEPKVGDQPLPQYLSCYTDYTQKPIPDPEELARIVKANNQRIVLLVDNCSRKNHETLTEIIGGSKVSLLTVDFDVQEDLPSETDVFVLESASKELLIELLNRRLPKIDKTILDNIADLSDGNSRVALALAQNFIKDGDFGTLQNEVVFERLFWQNKEQSGDLLETAEACSMVYSFNGSDPGSCESEIPLLAQLSAQTPELFYKNIKEINNRRLLQSRGQWSALLPQAVANRIASRALDTFTKNTLNTVFLNPNEDRLLSSFCHRLSFLHNISRASAIAEDFLGPTGVFGRKGLLLNDLDRQKIYFLLSIDFAVSLNYFQRLVDLVEETPIDYRFRSNIRWIVNSLLVLAYFPENFEQALGLVETLLLSQKSVEIIDSGVVEQIKNLFWSKFSRTSASPDMRHKHISNLFESTNQELNSLGVEFLSSTFQTEFFTGLWTTNFGARPLTLGYELKTVGELRKWFTSSLQILWTAVINHIDLRRRLLSIIETKFRGLWNSRIICDELTEFITQVIKDQPWTEIWVEIKKTLHFDGKKMNQTLLDELLNLEQMTRPGSLIEEVRIFLKRSELNLSLVEGDCEVSTSESQRLAYDTKMKELGLRVSRDIHVIDEIGPDLFTYGNYWINTFIESLTRNFEDPVTLWGILRDNYKRATTDRTLAVFSAFFKALQEMNPEVSDLLQKEISDDPDLSPILPVIIVYKKIVPSDINILSTLLRSGKSSPHLFWGVGSLQIGVQISEQDYCKILTILAETKGGYEIAISSIASKFDEYFKNTLQIPKHLLKVGQDLLFMANDPNLVNWRDPMPDLYLSRIISALPKSYLPNNKVRKFICSLFPEELAKLDFSNLHSEINKELSLRYPIELLDILFAKIGHIDPREDIFLLNSLERVGNIIQLVNSDVVLDWMLQDPFDRAQFLSRYLLLVEKDYDIGVMKWTEFGRHFLSSTYQIPMVLENIILRMHPTSWIGSYSLTLKMYLPLFNDALFDETTELKTWIENQKSQLLNEIRRHEESESQERNINFRFE